MLTVLSCLVIGISDGDTITCLDKQKETHKIRLAEIDAPEKRQDFGVKSKDNLAKMIYQKNVLVKYKQKDRYNRIVGYIEQEGKDINQKQINDGMAWYYTQYGGTVTYEIAQAKAKHHERGLWASSNYIAPWDYRKNEKEHRKSFATFQTDKTPTASISKTLNGYNCEKKTCKEISSCEEAKYLLKQCNYTSLDRDKNGIPCESLCN